jgi:hypothetical protein
MKCHIFGGQPLTLLRIEELEPVCGKDYCDSCGDCLHCYGSDPCIENEDGPHYWVRYENAPDDDMLSTSPIS